MNRFLRRKPRPDSVIPSSRQDGYNPIETVDSDLEFNPTLNQGKKTILIKQKQRIVATKKIEQR
jgi:hypothetical protein